MLCSGPKLIIVYTRLLGSVEYSILLNNYGGPNNSVGCNSPGKNVKILVN